MDRIQIDTVLEATVEDAEGELVGDVSKVLVSNTTKAISDIQVNLDGNYAKKLGFSGSFFRDVLVLIDAKSIADLGSEVTLTTDAEGLKEQIENRKKAS